MADIDQRAFRDALGRFPTGVTVVTAHDGDADAVAMTVSSFNAVSLDPPLVLFSVSRTAPSLPRLLAADHFGISILSHDQHELSSRFAGRVPDKWLGVAAARGETGCPLIDPCLATFECAPFAVHEGGDHLIVVGRVLRFAALPDGAPLVFFRGRYHAIAEQAI
ncbi:MAG: flavin reductase family protein [Sphingobium sp.]